MASNLKIGVSVDTKQGSLNIEKLNKDFEKFNKSTQNSQREVKKFEETFLGLRKSIIDMNAHMGQAVSFYLKGFEKISQFSHSFIDAAKQIENAKTQLTFLNATMHANFTTSGRAISQLEKWQLASKQANKHFEELNALHAKTGYSLQDLASMFQSFASNAINNMSFDKAKKAFENIMIATSNTSMSTEQLALTMDSLGAGAFSSSGDLRRFAESIGITNDAMKAAKENGQLYELLIEKTQELTRYTEFTSTTLQKQGALFETNLQTLKAALAEPIFESLKASLIDINSYFKENEESIKAFASSVGKFINDNKGLAMSFAATLLASKGFIKYILPSLLSLSNLYKDLATKQQIYNNAVKNAPKLEEALQVAKANAPNLMALSQKSLSEQELRAMLEVEKAQARIKNNQELINTYSKAKHPILATTNTLFKTGLSLVKSIMISLAPTAALFALSSAIFNMVENFKTFNANLKEFKNTELVNNSIDELEKKLQNLKKEQESLQAFGDVSKAKLNEGFLDTFYLRDFTITLRKGYDELIGRQTKLNNEALKQSEIYQKNIELVQKQIEEKKVLAQKANEEAIKEQEKLAALATLSNETKRALDFSGSLKIPQSEIDKARELEAALSELKRAYYEIVKLPTFRHNEALQTQAAELLEKRKHIELYQQKQAQAEAEKNAKQAHSEYLSRLKQKNEALKEISKLGLSEYEKKLKDINERLKEWQKLGIDKNKLKEAEKALKSQLDNEELKKRNDFLLEYYETLEQKQEAWMLKEAELRSKAGAFLNEEQLNLYVAKQKEAYFKVEKEAKKSFKNTENAYLEMIANMQRTIESRFFDFIEGKTRNLKELLKDIGKSLAMDVLKPYISSISGGISNVGGSILGGLLPNFSGAQTQPNTQNSSQTSNMLSSVLSFAKSNNLTLNKDTNKYEGMKDGVKIVVDTKGNVEQGKSALNDVSNIISGAQNLQGLMSGEWINTATKTYDTVMKFFNSSGTQTSFSEALSSNNFSNFLSSNSAKDVTSSIQSSSSSIMDTLGNGFNGIFSNMSNYIHNLGYYGSNMLAQGSFYLSSLFGGSSALASFGSGASMAGGFGAAGQGLAGMSSAFGTSFSTGLGFMGGMAANAGVWGAVGYGVGKLGDAIFGAQTKAGNYGAIGGAIGATIGSIIPGLGTALGGLVGAALGAVVGGFIGTWKNKDYGIALSGDIKLSEVDFSKIASFVDKEKKSWFKKKRKTEYSALDDKTLETLSELFASQLNLAKRLNANLNKLVITAGKYSKQSLVTEELSSAMLKAFLKTSDSSKINEQIASIKEAAKKNNTTYAEQLNNQFSSFITMQDEILSQIYSNDIIKQAKVKNESVLATFKNLVNSANGGFKLFGLSEANFKDIGQISATTFNRAFNESLRNDFSAENVEVWKNLSQAFSAAKEQAKALLEAVIKKTSELMSLNQSFLNANQINSAALAMNDLINQYEVIFSALKKDLSKNEQAALSDIFKANDEVLKWGFDGVNAFLQGENSELRKQLLTLITQLKSAVDENGGFIFATSSLASLGKVDEQIKKAEQKGTQENLKEQIRNNEKLLSVLNAQASILSTLKNTSDNLISQSLNTSAQIETNYKQALSAAKAAYENNDFNSSAFNALQSAISQQASSLKNTSQNASFYRLEMLKMANESKSLGGKADLNSVQNEIAKLSVENAKLQKQILQAINDTSNMSVEELKAYKEQLLKTSKDEVNALVSYLGETSPMSKYLRELITSLEDGNTSTQAALKSLSYAVAAYKQNASTNAGALNANVANPYVPFANGGIVTRPTNALIGEAGYPEAVIPLKDGAGLKVDMSGGFLSLKELLVKVVDKLSNIDSKEARMAMDLSIITKQTRQIIENQ